MEPINSDPLHPGAAHIHIPTTSSGPRDPRLRDVFVKMVQYELRDGLLRYSRRRELVNFARRLGIPEFEAHLLIAQAQYGESFPETASIGQIESAYLVSPSPWPSWVKVSLAALAAAAIDLALIYWVIG